MTTKWDFTPIVGPWSRPKDFSGSGYDLSIYALETTQRHVYGRRFITWDGKRFKYCRSLGTLLAGFGAANIAPQNIGAVAPAAMAVGAEVVKVTIAATDGYAANGVIAEDELIGGQFVAGHGAEALAQTRTIMANTAVAANGGTCLVTLDGPIAVAMTANSSYVEIALNPYRYLSKGAYEYNAFMSVPAIGVTSGYNFWGQTGGPCWVCPGGGDATPGNTVNDREAFFVGDGSVNFGTALTVETGYQRAGYCIDQTSAALSAMPLIMLELD